MDRYTNGFTSASLFYFFLAAGLGFRMGAGATCFSCPGQATETIRQSAMRHNMDEKRILGELNRAAGLPHG